MSHTFSAPLIKIARARKHLAELETEVAAFLSSKPAIFETGILTSEEGTQAAQVDLKIIRWPPDELGAIVGDVVHNLRSALDLTACEMVRAVEGLTADVRRVYFPFCSRQEHLDDVIRSRDFHRAGDRAVGFLRGLKPYPGGDAALRAIHDLDIQDKHTALIVALMNIGSPVLSRWDDDGTPNLSFIGDPTEPSKLRLIFPRGSALAERQIIPTLHELVDLTLGIIEAFRALANS